MSTAWLNAVLSTSDVTDDVDVSTVGASTVSVCDGIMSVGPMADVGTAVVVVVVLDVDTAVAVGSIGTCVSVDRRSVAADVSCGCWSVTRSLPLSSSDDESKQTHSRTAKNVKYYKAKPCGFRVLRVFGGGFTFFRVFS